MQAKGVSRRESHLPVVHEDRVQNDHQPKAPGPEVQPTIGPGPQTSTLSNATVSRHSSLAVRGVERTLTRHTDSVLSVFALSR